MSVRNAQGEQVTQGTKQPDLPNAPTIGTVTDVGTGRAYNNGAVDVAFTPAGYWDSTFTATSTPGSLTGTGSSSPVTVTGLNSQTSYTFTVKGNNAQNLSGANSSASSSVTATTVPQAPTITGFTDGGTGSGGSLSFTAGATGGKLITDYKWSTDNITYTSAGTTTSPFNIGGLSVGNYTFYLKAVNANGDSAASTGFSGTVIQPTAFESIATVTLGADGTVTFSSIPTTYKALQIRWMARDVTSGNSLTYLTYKINGSTTNYASHYLEGNGSTVSSFGTTTPGYADYCGEMFFDTGNPVYGVGIMDIIDYASTSKTKTIRVFGGADRNGQGAVRLSSNLWNSTSAITSITFSSSYVNIKAGSTFALYGIS